MAPLQAQLKAGVLHHQTTREPQLERRTRARAVTSTCPPGLAAKKRPETYIPRRNSKEKTNIPIFQSPLSRKQAPRHLHNLVLKSVGRDAHIGKALKQHHEANGNSYQLHQRLLPNEEMFHVKLVHLQETLEAEETLTLMAKKEEQ